MPRLSGQFLTDAHVATAHTRSTTNQRYPIFSINGCPPHSEPRDEADPPCLFDPLLQARALARAMPQVIELRAPHPRLRADVDGRDHRRVDRERALDALALDDAADGEGRR